MYKYFFSRNYIQPYGQAASQVQLSNGKGIELLTCNRQLGGVVVSKHPQANFFHLALPICETCRTMQIWFSIWNDISCYKCSRFLNLNEGYYDLQYETSILLCSVHPYQESQAGYIPDGICGQGQQHQEQHIPSTHDIKIH